eukprot:1082489-Rhodomonas_salina.2
MVLHNFLQIHDSVQWYEIHDSVQWYELLEAANVQGVDPELCTWDAVQQKLYCVHTDLIITMDKALAHANNVEHSRGAGCGNNGGGETLLQTTCGTSFLSNTQILMAISQRCI